MTGNIRVLEGIQPPIYKVMYYRILNSLFCNQCIHHFTKHRNRLSSYKYFLLCLVRTIFNYLWVELIVIIVTSKVFTIQYCCSPVVNIGQNCKEYLYSIELFVLPSLVIVFLWKIRDAVFDKYYRKLWYQGLVKATVFRQSLSVPMELCSIHVWRWDERSKHFLRVSGVTSCHRHACRFNGLMLWYH
jgi:hypothetical protein